MKKKILTIILVMAAIVSFAATSLSTKQSGWALRGTVTAGITTPGVTARDAVSVEALSGALIDVMPTDVAIILRASGATDDTVNIYDIMIMASESDHYTRAATLSFTTGTQTSPVTGEEFADLITATNEKWHSDPKNVSGSDNYIGEYSIDLYGIKKVKIIPTTIVTSSSIWYRGV